MVKSCFKCVTTKFVVTTSICYKLNQAVYFVGKYRHVCANPIHANLSGARLHHHFLTCLLVILGDIHMRSNEPEYYSYCIFSILPNWSNICWPIPMSENAYNPNSAPEVMGIFTTWRSSLKIGSIACKCANVHNSNILHLLGQNGMKISME